MTEIAQASNWIQNLVFLIESRALTTKPLRPTINYKTDQSEHGFDTLYLHSQLTLHSIMTCETFSSIRTESTKSPGLLRLARTR